ncbi:MAG: bifunctional phosphopantothenoylcysteine decarboxylase/phosphopantothenate--cysteine ligase CoaBC [Verrucomicrobia bacterium]|nr:bifunctional phosphopantothenoylcysteine decarboxylase/phosphopantothenate--cysteine ligase CoaBC [Verrucomicrobiota bacterium]
MSGADLIVVVTGSIAAAKACEVISRLVQGGHRVRVVATEAALRFVGPATFEGLTGLPVLTDLFAPGAALEHITLTRRADLVLVCPATAHTLNRLAAGLADDFPGALFLAHDREKPWLMAPAMNPAMWAHPATISAVARLREWGVGILPVGSGRTACGETGEGRLAEPAEIVAAVEAALHRPVRRLRVLVTGGGTAEPIDGLRVLTNTSTGATGAGLVDHLRRMGHEAVWLHGRRAVQPAAPGPTEEFGSFADLDAALRRWLGGTPFDAVVHAAAVSDFGVEAIESGGVVQLPAGAKLDSQLPLRLHLRPHPKLVDRLRTLSLNPHLRVVAFKLTNGASPAARAEAVGALLRRARPDWVVHNDLASRGADGAFPADIFGPDGTLARHCPDRRTLAETLERLLADAPT